MSHRGHVTTIAGPALLAALALVSGAVAARPANERFEPPEDLDDPELGSEALGLLQQAEVQKDLGLSEEQVRKIRDLQSGSQADMQREIQDLITQSGGMPGANEQFQKQFRDKVTAIQTKASKAAEGLLTLDQLTRLKAIRLKRLGPVQLDHPAMAQRLGLSQEQQEKLKSLRTAFLEKLKAEMAAMNQAPPENRKARMEEMQKKSKEIQKSLEEDMLKVLTPVQRKRFEKLKTGAGG